ncbi:MAG: GNAT family N-acetyltransferase [Actinomycetota bacterium]
MQLKKESLAHQDEPFLIALYSSTRSDELALVSWDNAEKHTFLLHQFHAQQQHYFSKYPNASYQIIKLNDISIGRLYVAEVEDEIKILDLTILAEYRGQTFGTQLIKEILAEAGKKNKSVEIYIENFNRSQNLFKRLNFQPESDGGIYVIWRWGENSSNL